MYPKFELESYEKRTITREQNKNKMMKKKLGSECVKKI